MDAESTYRLELAWPDPSAQLRREATELWAREGAIVDPAVAADRAAQLLVVARDEGGQLTGLSTVQARPVRSLGFDCFYYRTFIASGHRRRGLAPLILMRAHQELDARFSAGLDSGVRGLLIEAQSPIIAGPAGEASWAKRGMPGCVFVGWSQRGLQLRVWYFNDARIPAQKIERAGGGEPR